MNIHIKTGANYEYSYNLANLRENWAQKNASGYKAGTWAPVYRAKVRLTTPGPTM